MEVECPAQAPRLDELTALPEGVADILLRDPVDAPGELQLRRRLNLRMHPTDVVNDFEQTVGARPHSQEATRETTCATSWMPRAMRPAPTTTAPAPPR